MIGDRALRAPAALTIGRATTGALLPALGAGDRLVIGPCPRGDRESLVIGVALSAVIPLMTVVTRRTDDATSANLGVQERPF